ncbi:hypothetical protein BH09MYX1_BH09MYX1_20480 [soil metagenome]
MRRRSPCAAHVDTDAGGNANDQLVELSFVDVTGGELAYGVARDAAIDGDACGLRECFDDVENDVSGQGATARRYGFHFGHQARAGHCKSRAKGMTAAIERWPLRRAAICNACLKMRRWGEWTRLRRGKCGWLAPCNGGARSHSLKLVAKFALAFFLATTAIIAIYSYFATRRQVARIEENVVLDLRSLGGGLRSAITASWRADGESEALRIVAAAESERSDVDIRWVPGLPPAADDVVDDRHDTVDDRVTVSLPVRVDGGHGGMLILTRELPGTGTILGKEAPDDVVVALALALVLGGIAVLLGVVLIGRPLDRIVAQTRRVGAGDLSQRLKGDRNDEIGVIKRELNAMCDQLVSAQKKLEDEAAARLETLEQLRHLDRLRSVGMRASSVAHELGTPLNVLLIRGQALAEGEDETEIKAAGRTIVGQVEKMSRIVRQMLDFSRAKEPTSERVSAKTLVERATNLLSAIAKKNGVVLTRRIEDDGPIDGHPGEIEQALTNLMMNAIHASPKGGKLELVVRRGEASLPRRAHLATGSGARPGGTFSAMMIDVRDDGSGMTEETLERIFEPFYTTKRKGEGTGLGLTVASGIAEDHGGFITAQSELGRGSTFTLTLPRSR